MKKTKQIFSWTYKYSIFFLCFYTVTTFGVPYLFQHMVLPKMAYHFSIKINVEDIIFDLSKFTLTFHNTHLENPIDGKRWITIENIHIDIHLLESIKNNAITISGNCIEPVVHLQTRFYKDILSTNRINKKVAFYVPFIIEEFTIEKGKILFSDTYENAVSFRLNHFSNREDNKFSIVYLRTKDNQGGSFSVDGLFEKNTHSYKGILEIKSMALESWKDVITLIKPNLNLSLLVDGKVEGHIHFYGTYLPSLTLEAKIDTFIIDKFKYITNQIRATSEQIKASNGTYSFTDNHLKWQSISLNYIETPYGKSDTIRLENVLFNGGENISINTFSIQKLDTLLGHVSSVLVKGIFFDLEKKYLKTNSVILDKVKLENVPIKIECAFLEKITFDPFMENLVIGNVQVNKFAFSGITMESIVSENFSYRFLEESFTYFSVKVHNVVATKDSVFDTYQKVFFEQIEKNYGILLHNIHLNNVQLSKISGSIKKRELKVEAFFLEHAVCNIQHLTLSSTRSVPSAEKENIAAIPISLWKVEIDSLLAKEYSLDVIDANIDPHTPVKIGPGLLRVAHFTTLPNALFTFYLKTQINRLTTIEIDGQARLQPFQIDVRFGIDKCWLPTWQPYWQGLSGINLHKGQLNLWGDLTLWRDPVFRIDYSGSADFVDVESIDQHDLLPFLGWHSLKLDSLVIHTYPKRFSVRTVIAEKPYLRVTIDNSGNFVQVLSPSDKGQNAPSSILGEWPAIAGLLKIRNGQIDFSDLTLEPGFFAKIRDMNGDISGLSSQKNAKTNFLLKGQVDGNAPVTLYGRFAPFAFQEDTDATLDFREFNLASLSGYTGKFSGYRIEKGKMNLALHYQIQNRHLDIDNHIVLNQLVLGERVESQKMTDVPVHFAIALLKDADGQIDLDLPITGRLDDPDFSLKNLYSNALKQLIVKIVTSPFTFLGSVIESDEEHLSFVHFPPGKTELTSYEKEELNEIARLLKARPALQLNIKGEADWKQDHLALAEEALNRKVDRLWQSEYRKEHHIADTVAIPSVPKQDYERLIKLSYAALVSEAGGLMLPDTVTIDTIRHTLLEHWKISETELHHLAQARSESVRDYLVKQHGIQDHQVYLLDVQLKHSIESQETPGVVLSLSGV